jgi:hypothetical protein
MNIIDKSLIAQVCEQPPRKSESEIIASLKAEVEKLRAAIGSIETQAMAPDSFSSVEAFARYILKLTREANPCDATPSYVGRVDCVSEGSYTGFRGTWIRSLTTDMYTSPRSERLAFRYGVLEEMWSSTFLKQPSSMLTFFQNHSTHGHLGSSPLPCL